MLRKNAYDLFLSLDDVEKIHESTLRVLKEVGVEFKHEEVPVSYTHLLRQSDY